MGKEHFFIEIPNPCHQDWEQMTPDNHGRFCGSCQKSVIDFTEWSDARLYQFLARNNRPVCGRFLATQINRQIQLPPQPHSQLYRIAIAFGLTLLFTQIGEVKAQTRAPIVASALIDSMSAKDSLSTSDSFGIIHGIVTDGKMREPLINCSIRLSQGGVLKVGTITDYDGKYRLIHIVPGDYELTISYIGMQRQTIKSVIVTAGGTTELNVVLRQTNAGVVLGGSMGVFRPPLQDKFVPNKITITKDQLKNMGH